MKAPRLNLAFTCRTYRKQNGLLDMEKEAIDLENEIETLQSEAREYQGEIKDLKNKIDNMQDAAYDIYKM